MGKNVSVYGTLRKGERANYMLDKAKFIGESNENLNLIMVNLGAFPALLESKEVNPIVLETYELSDDDNTTELRLDQYEGYPSFYGKKKITLASGVESMVYFMERNEMAYEGQVITSGNWKDR